MVIAAGRAHRPLLGLTPTAALDRRPPRRHRTCYRRPRPRAAGRAAPGPAGPSPRSAAAALTLALIYSTPVPWLLLSPEKAAGWPPTCRRLDAALSRRLAYPEVRAALAPPAATTTSAAAT